MNNALVLNSQMLTRTITQTAYIYYKSAIISGVALGLLLSPMVL